MIYNMGKVTIDIEITNHSDENLFDNNFLIAEKIRKVIVDKVLVDTGATTLCLPKNVIETLGLKVSRKIVVNTATGDYVTNIYQDAKITIKGRSCVVECIELPDNRTPLLGVIPMEMMGLEIDVVKHELKLLPDFSSDTYLLALGLSFKTCENLNNNDF